jgi:hypothetical protein
MLRYLRYAFGSSRVANSAYQNWPTQGPDSCPILNEVRISTAPIRSLIISRDENHPNASDHLLYLAQLGVPGYPERNFGGNQLLDSSMSLSPLYLDLTSDLHVSIAPNVHQGFPWLPSAQEKVAIFRVPASVLCFRSLSQKIRTEPCCIPQA